MSDILLAKPKLPPDWIDVSVGEPHIVRSTLLEYFHVEPLSTYSMDHEWEYPAPAGYQPLVDKLQEQYGHPVIITNGAKQALGACFYALKKLGKLHVGMIEPYWALIPPLMDMHGLIPAIGKHPYNVDAFLALAPNNPDGQFPHLEVLEDTCKSKKIPFIHDAAYYTHVYLPKTTELKVYGDAQIFSVSKMFGISGLRLGYVVCKNPDFYRLIQEYMEAMTVGVSIVSQLCLLNLLQDIENNPTDFSSFEEEALGAINVAKLMMLGVDPEVLKINPLLIDRPGMFGWFGVGPRADFKKSKINVIDGALFGGPGMVRMNLAFNETQMQDLVNRLNSVKT
jgi:aspartate/methionine/tyrosine aminotransferase